MEEEIESYGDTGVTSQNHNISIWLKILYIFLPIAGLIWLYFYWNGFASRLDPDHWRLLQKAANTLIEK